MPDLLDGEITHVQGSASKPYEIKNIAGVYSCTCPAWRNQSLPIDRRTCKHIGLFRGTGAEVARIGVNLTERPKNNANAVKVPPLMLAETWDGESDPTGWLLSEKLDGARCWWDGKQMLSRQGQRYFAPDWFTEGLPLEPLDGELWIGRKQFQRTVSIVRRQDGGDLWKEVRFLVFDAPAHDGPFEERLELIKLVMSICRPAYAQAHVHERCQDADHLRRMLASVEQLGGEGLMLRQPGSLYNAGRSSTLLKVKSFLDSEATVVGHEGGSGRHKGRLGALLVALANGTRFAIGTGLSDREREMPPPVGTVINFRYQELSDNGVPRFPVYAGIRPDAPQVKGDDPMKSAVPAQPVGHTKRRFEFVEGTSSKFWEETVSGAGVHVQFGRIGTEGQGQTKFFDDEAAANKHADRLVRQKLAKGYVEVNS